VQHPSLSHTVLGMTPLTPSWRWQALDRMKVLFPGLDDAVIFQVAPDACVRESLVMVS
jgi:hypothetical protein